MNRITEIKEKIYKGISNKAINITEKSFSKCALIAWYEPKLPSELLNEIKK